MADYLEIFLHALGYEKKEAIRLGKLISKEHLQKPFRDNLKKQNFHHTREQLLSIFEETISDVSGPILETIYHCPFIIHEIKPDKSHHNLILFDRYGDSYENLKVDNMKFIIFNINSFLYCVSMYEINNQWFHDEKIRHYDSLHKEKVCPLCSENVFSSFDDYSCFTLTLKSKDLIDKLLTQHNMRLKVLHEFPGKIVPMKEVLESIGYIYDNKTNRFYFSK